MNHVSDVTMTVTMSVKQAFVGEIGCQRY